MEEQIKKKDGGLITCSCALKGELKSTLAHVHGHLLYKYIYLYLLDIMYVRFLSTKANMILRTYQKKYPYIILKVSSTIS